MPGISGLVVAQFISPIQQHFTTIALKEDFEFQSYDLQELRSVNKGVDDILMR
jgi:hypothetical protein